MTTVIAFAPSPLTPFEFQATLDGQVCTVRITSNLFGQRWYINVKRLDGTLILARALVGSPAAKQLALLMWNATRGLVSAVTAAPHGFVSGSAVDLIIAGNTPATFDGAFRCDVTGPSSFAYPLAADPGADAATILGTADWRIDLVEGYFTTSSLVFRQDAQQFEIAP